MKYIKLKSLLKESIVERKKNRFLDFKKRLEKIKEIAKIEFGYID